MGGAPATGYAFLLFFFGRRFTLVGRFFDMHTSVHVRRCQASLDRLRRRVKQLFATLKSRLPARQPRRASATPREREGEPGTVCEPNA